MKNQRIFAHFALTDMDAVDTVRVESCATGNPTSIPSAAELAYSYMLTGFTTNWLVMRDIAKSFDEFGMPASAAICEPHGIAAPNLFGSASSRADGSVAAVPRTNRTSFLSRGLGRSAMQAPPAGSPRGA